MAVISTYTASLFLNPQVNENCTNLWLDYAYCIEPVGTIKTYDGYDGYTTRPPLNQTPTTELPDRPGPIDLIGNNTAPAVPKASGTRKDCYRW